MNKPNCECVKEIINAVRKQKNLPDEAFVMFNNQNLFTGGLVNYLEITQVVKTKAGKEREKVDKLAVGHSYCPFCGKKYKTDERVIVTSQKSFSPPEPLSTEVEIAGNLPRIVYEGKILDA